jgi:hypothetical protein
MKAIIIDSSKIRNMRICKILKKRKLSWKEKFGDFRENIRKVKIK